MRPHIYSIINEVNFLGARNLFLVLKWIINTTISVWILWKSEFFTFNNHQKSIKNISYDFIPKKANHHLSQIHHQRILVHHYSSHGEFSMNVGRLILSLVLSYETSSNFLSNSTSFSQFAVVSVRVSFVDFWHSRNRIAKISRLQSWWLPVFHNRLCLVVTIFIDRSGSHGNCQFRRWWFKFAAMIIKSSCQQYDGIGSTSFLK